MSIRRSRFAVRPNLAPKGRVTTPKQDAPPAAAGEAPAEAEKSDTSRNVTTTETDQLPVSSALNQKKGSTKSSLELGPTAGTSDDSAKHGIVRRPRAKAKPTIPARGLRSAGAEFASAAKESINASTTEPNGKEGEIGQENSCTEVAQEESEKENVQEEEQEVGVSKKQTSQTSLPEGTQSGTSDEKNAEHETTKKENKPLPGRFRRFVKARPNVEAVARTRYPSISQSDVDSVVLKDPPPVHRVTSATCSETPQVFSEVVARSQNVTPRKEIAEVRKTPFKTPTREEQKQEPPVKKVKKTVMLDTPVDRSKMKMKDLIRMCPKSNPMILKKQEEQEKSELISSLSPDKRAQRRNSTASSASSCRVKVGANGQIVLEEQNEVDDIDSQEDDTVQQEESIPAPQVTIGKDGQIVINEASLVLDNPMNKPSKQEDMEVIHETSHWSSTAPSYGYARKKRTKAWTENETKKFYMALNAIGTDFSLMVKLFPNRSRRDLKKKFQKEERASRPLVDKAITDRYKFQFEQDFFDELKKLDELDEELRETKPNKKSQSDTKAKSTKGTKVTAEREKLPRRKRKRKAKLYDDSSEESETEELAGVERDEEFLNEDKGDASDEVEVLAHMQGRKSRSGRTIRTFVLGQPGATATETVSESTRLSGAKPATEIRIRRVSETHGSLGPRPRTLSTGSTGNPRHRTLSGSSSASGGRGSGQFLSLSNIQAGSETPGGSSNVHPGSLVCVQSTGSVNEKGEVTPGLVHIYMVSPTGTSPPSDGAQVLSAEEFTALKAHPSPVTTAVSHSTGSEKTANLEDSETIEIELDVDNAVPIPSEQEVVAGDENVMLDENVVSLQFVDSLHRDKQ